jgi:hypothetical protein
MSVRRRSSPRRSPPRSPVDSDTDSFISDPITLSSDEEKDISSDEEEEEEDDEVYLKRMLKKTETYTTICERREKGFNDFIKRWTSVLGEENLEEPPESAFHPRKHYEIPREHLIDRKSSPRRTRPRT